MSVPAVTWPQSKIRRPMIRQKIWATFGKLVLTTATSTSRSPSNRNLMQMQHNPVHETVVIVPYLLEVFSGLPTMLEDRSHFNNRWGRRVCIDHVWRQIWYRHEILLTRYNPLFWAWTREAFGIGECSKWIGILMSGWVSFGLCSVWLYPWVQKGTYSTKGCRIGRRGKETWPFPTNRSYWRCTEHQSNSETSNDI